MNLKYTVERALEKRDEKCLSYLANELNHGHLNSILIDCCTEDTEAFVNLDIALLGDPNFQPEAPCLIDAERGNLSEVIHYTTFLMKYKLQGFENTDDFKKTARVVYREPPIVIDCLQSQKRKVKYLTLENITNKVMYDVCQEELFVEEEVASDSESGNPIDTPPGSPATPPGSPVCPPASPQRTVWGTPKRSFNASEGSIIKGAPSIRSLSPILAPKMLKMDSEKGARPPEQLHLHFHLPPQCNKVEFKGLGFECKFNFEK